MIRKCSCIRSAAYLAAESGKPTARLLLSHLPVTPGNETQQTSEKVLELHLKQNAHKFSFFNVTPKALLSLLTVETITGQDQAQLLVQQPVFSLHALGQIQARTYAPRPVPIRWLKTAAAWANNRVQTWNNSADQSFVTYGLREMRMPLRLSSVQEDMMANLKLVSSQLNSLDKQLHNRVPLSISNDGMTAMAGMAATSGYNSEATPPCAFALKALMGHYAASMRMVNVTSRPTTFLPDTGLSSSNVTNARQANPRQLTYTANTINAYPNYTGGVRFYNFNAFDFFNSVQKGTAVGSIGAAAWTAYQGAQGAPTMVILHDSSRLGVSATVALIHIYTQSSLACRLRETFTVAVDGVDANWDAEYFALNCHLELQQPTGPATARFQFLFLDVAMGASVMAIPNYQGAGIAGNPLQNGTHADLPWGNANGQFDWALVSRVFEVPESWKLVCGYYQSVLGEELWSAVELDFANIAYRCPVQVFFQGNAPGNFDARYATYCGGKNDDGLGVDHSRVWKLVVGNVSNFGTNVAYRPSCTFPQGSIYESVLWLLSVPAPMCQCFKLEATNLAARTGPLASYMHDIHAAYLLRTHFADIMALPLLWQTMSWHTRHDQLAYRKLMVAKYQLLAKPVEGIAQDYAWPDQIGFAYTPFSVGNAIVGLVLLSKLLNKDFWKPEAVPQKDLIRYRLFATSYVTLHTDFTTDQAWRFLQKIPWLAGTLESVRWLARDQPDTRYALCSGALHADAWPVEVYDSQVDHNTPVTTWVGTDDYGLWTLGVNYANSSVLTSAMQTFNQVSFEKSVDFAFYGEKEKPVEDVVAATDSFFL